MAQTKITVDGITGLTSSATELNYVDITTLGTAQASKVLTADANIDVGLGLRNLTGTGFLQGSTILVKGTTNSITIDADNPSAYTVVLPNAAPAAGKVLKTTSSSTTQLEWGDAGGGAISAVTNGSSDRIATFTSTTALNGEANLTFDGQNLYLINSTTDSSSNLMVNSSATSGTTHARLILRVGSGNAGDAFISFHNQAGAGTEWQLGMDSSDADAGGAKKFKLGYGSGLDSSRTSMIVTNAPGSGSGASACSQLPQINFPTRSCGTVRVSSDINNQTGDGNQYQVQFGTVVYDQNNDWSNAATGGNGNTFYAPVSGLYLFIVQISFKDNLSADSNEILVYLNTNYPSGGGTNYNLFNQPGRPDGIGTGNPYSTGGSVIAYLEAGDYANVKVRVSGDGSNNVQIEGGGGFASFFSWALLA